MPGAEQENRAVLSRGANKFLFPRKPVLSQKYEQRLTESEPHFMIVQNRADSVAQLNHSLIPPPHYMKNPIGIVAFYHRTMRNYSSVIVLYPTDF